ncbi:MAG TPA: hypothetical protein VIV06_09020 [Candidatus Limnocylindrales bacterium]
MSRPRNAFAITVLFGVIATVYWFASYDAGGTTTLAALGIAMGTLFYFLLAGAHEL